jgi:hypothetical protein
LVIDTIGQKVGPLSMVDMYGTPFSAALHVIERYRLIDGATARDLQLKHESAYFGAGTLNPTVSEYGIKIDPDSTNPGLQVEITVDDPLTFTTPWSAFVNYRHILDDSPWPEGGSVRTPAALCGVIGFKPSKYRVPTDGAFSLSYSLDSIGPIARSVKACADADAVLAGEAPRPLEQ